MGEVYRARDPDRVARFQREAKTLAALDHPNIGGIYAVEEAPGITALVLEPVEGPALTDRIAQGPIPIAEPANIKVREDGTVEVLDFGLARAFAGKTRGGSFEPFGSVPFSPFGFEAGGIIAPPRASARSSR